MDPTNEPSLVTEVARQFGDLPGASGPAAAAVGLFYLLAIVGGLALNLILLVRWRRRPVPWTERVTRLRWRPWDVRDVAWVLLPVAGLHLAAAILVRAWPEAGMALEEDASLQIVLGSILSHWTALTAVAVLLWRARLTWRDGFGLGVGGLTRQAAEAGLFLLAAFPVILFYFLLSSLLLQGLGFEVLEQDVVRIIAEENGWAAQAYFVFVAVVLAPLAEEVFFRGLLLPALAKRFRFGVAVAVSSGLFAAMHAHLPSFVPLFVLATALSLAYLKTGRLLVPVLMHALFNAHSLLLLHLRGATW